MHRSLALITLVAALAAAPAAAPSAAPLAVERLDFPSGAKAAQPSVAVDARDGFVVTWQERDGDASALRYAVLDAGGRERRRGTVSTGKDRFVNGADFPNLAVLDNGDWTTFWLQKTAADTYAYEVRLVRSRDRGRTWDAPVVVHRDGTATEHGFVSMAPAGGDRVRLVWLDGRRMARGAEAHAGSAHAAGSHAGGAHGAEAPEHMTLRGAVLGRDGVPREESELDTLTCACCQTELVRAGASTIAAYRDRTEAEVRDVGVLVHDGRAWSKPARAHADGWTMPACPVNGPALAARGDEIALAWPTMASGEMDVLVARADGESPARFGSPVALARGATELGRVDLAAWGEEAWLALRVALRGRVPTLVVSALDPSLRERASLDVAGPVGGYPRIAVSGGTALVAWTEPVAGESGATRIGLARITAAP